MADNEELLVRLRMLGAEDAARDLDELGSASRRLGDQTRRGAQEAGGALQVYERVSRRTLGTWRDFTTGVRDGWNQARRAAEQATSTTRAETSRQEGLWRSFFSGIREGWERARRDAQEAAQASGRAAETIARNNNRASGAGAAGVAAVAASRAGSAREGRAGGGIIAGGRNLYGTVAGLAATGYALGFMRDTVSEASNLNEALTKSNTIFGQQAAQIEQWANTAAKTMGLSKGAALGVAAQYGDMFQQLGWGSKQAADLSQKTIQLAADLGSFNNVNTSEVLDMISASMRGEYDSLQRIIPGINAARIEQEAMAMTGVKTAKSLTMQQKAAATLAIITKDGAKAQGDFAKNQNSYAVKQQQFTAMMAETKAEIGQGLLPVLTELMRTFIDSGGVSIIKDLGAVIISLFKGVAPVLKPVLDILKAIMPVVTFLANIVGGALKVAFEAIGWVIERVVDAFKWIGENAGPIFGGIGRAFQAVGGGVKAVWDNTIGWVINRIIDGWNALQNINNAQIAGNARAANDGSFERYRAAHPEAAKRYAELQKRQNVGGKYAGGVMPGYAPGVDSIDARLSPGEAVLVPEVTRAIGPKTILSWNAEAVAQRRSGGRQGFAFGGIAGNNPTYMGSGLLADLTRIQQQRTQAVWGQMVQQAAQAAQAGQAVPGVQVAPSGSGPDRWRPVAEQALKMTGQYSKQNLESMMRRMNMESSGNPNAINKWDCLPVRTKILTRRGWLAHDEVQVGDETIGYNPETGRSEWTRITRIVHYRDAETVRMGNKRWSVEGTENHRWLVDDRGRGERMVETRDLTSRQTIIVAVPAETGDGLDITDDEAAMLGWIAGDGTVERNRSCPSMSITQSKREHFPAIEEALAGVPHARYEYPDRTDSVQWRLDPGYARELIAKVGHPKLDAERIVLGMSAGQRRRWLDAMIAAEGTRNGKYVQVYQCDGPVREALKLAIYLCGNRPSESKLSGKDQWAPCWAHGITRPRVSGFHRFVEDAGTQDVWCVTTELGTWTAEQDGQVFLTGNSNWRKGTPSKGLWQVIDPTFKSYAMPGYDKNIWDPLSNALASIRYAVDRYGSLRAAYDKAGGYDSGGWLPPDGGIAVNNLRQPEAVLTPSQWSTAERAISNTVTNNESGVTVQMQPGAVVINGADDPEAVGDYLAERFGALLDAEVRRRRTTSLKAGV